LSNRNARDRHQLKVVQRFCCAASFYFAQEKIAQQKSKSTQGTVIILICHFVLFSIITQEIVFNKYSGGDVQMDAEEFAASLKEILGPGIYNYRRIYMAFASFKLLD